MTLIHPSEQPLVYGPPAMPGPQPAPPAPMQPAADSAWSAQLLVLRLGEGVRREGVVEEQSRQGESGQAWS